MRRKEGPHVKVLLIGVLLGLAIGVGLTVFYFALADFFRIQARLASRAASEMTKKTNEPQPPQTNRKAG